MENLRTAARAGIHARFLHFQQCFVNCELGDARKIVHFHHGKRFQVYVWMPLLQPADQLQKVFERQIRMQAADDMYFCGDFAHALRR